MTASVRKTSINNAPIGPGTALGRYRLLERIGEGGMGEVWKAHDDNLDRDVAIKMLLHGTLGNATNRERFRREALVLSRLSHPGGRGLLPSAVDRAGSPALDGGAVHWRRWRWVGGLGSRFGRGSLCVRHGTEIVCGDLSPVSI